jgi:ATP/maltotriose-dependent transcriptional regulator MalT/DNA-binding SARP family transcriptional activator
MHDALFTVQEDNPIVSAHPDQSHSSGSNGYGTFSLFKIPSKISPPSGTGLYPRRRLFEILDNTRQQCSILWISAPSGSGKTSLVASYLHERRIKAIWFKVDAGDGDVASFFNYMNIAAQGLATPGYEPLPSLPSMFLPNLESFARNNFRDLYQRLPTQSLIVLDNFQDAPHDSPLVELLSIAIQEIPHDLNLVILSRIEPPPTIARLRLCDHVMLIDWSAIRFTPEEMMAVLELRLGTNPLRANIVQNVYERTQGWVAGLVLMLEQHDTCNVFDSSQATSDKRLLFDYFTSEIFTKIPKQTRDFLLKTALLPKTTAAMATELTGHPNAKALLTELARCNLFPLWQKNTTATDISYEYHPLFREFLLTRFASDIAEPENRTLQRSAAKILLDVGCLDESVTLLINSRLWDTLIDAVLKYAPILINKDEGMVISSWIGAIPHEIRRNTPWLGYWLGVCRLPSHPLESRGILEEAYARFTETSDWTGCYLSWCAIVDSVVLEWNGFSLLDKWLDEAQRFQAQPPPNTEVADRFAGAMFTALVNRRPQRELVAPWEEKVIKILIHHPNLQLRRSLGNSLLFYLTSVKGDLNAAEIILQDIRPLIYAQDVSTLTKKIFGAIVGVFFWMSGNTDQCLLEVEAALETGRVKGVHVWNNFLHAQAQFATIAHSHRQSVKTQARLADQLPTAEQLFDKMMFHYLQGWHALQQGEVDMAARHAEAATEMASIVGSPSYHAKMQLAWSVALYHQGNQERAKDLLAQSRNIGQLIQAPIIAYIVALTQAEYALLEGQDSNCLAALRQALFISRSHGIRIHGWWRHGLMSKFYALALAHNIEVEYVRSVIRHLKISPPKDSVIPDNWPYPLKIYTLGRFALIKEGEPLKFEGKVQKKPLALLKLLLALGGREVSEVKITEVLWPDADGDVAHANLKPAVHRLRKLVGEEVIIWRESRLSINPQHCWVDAWAFQRLAGELATRLPDKTCIQRLCALYQGAFLGGEEEAYTIVPAERMRAKFLAAVQHCGRSLCECGAHTEALALYNRGLEVEPLAETFYQGLMREHLALNQSAEGLCVYARCCKTLRSQLGIEPSHETQTIARKLGQLSS